MTLVERLRTAKDHFSPNDDLGWRPDALRIEAADRIESLEAELSKAREAALEEAAKVADEKESELYGRNGELTAMQIATAIRSLSHKEG